MSTHLEQELEQTKTKIFTMADLAVEAISDSIESLKNGDVALAQTVIEKDSVLDQLEKTIDNECIRLLVMRQPAAVHFRMVLLMIKINTDLERIGDLSTNIAKETIELNGKKTLKPLVDVPRMAAICIGMIRDSLQAITDMDVEKAKSVIARDHQIDELNLQVNRELLTYMAENPQIITQALGLIMVAKALERIGDHATNIAERAVYYIEGIDIRHEDIE
jgi:phosphate transport system protein